MTVSGQPSWVGKSVTSSGRTRKSSSKVNGNILLATSTRKCNNDLIIITTIKIIIITKSMVKPTNPSSTKRRRILKMSLLTDSCKHCNLQNHNHDNNYMIGAVKIISDRGLAA